MYYVICDLFGVYYLHSYCAVVEIKIFYPCLLWNSLNIVICLPMSFVLMVCCLVYVCSIWAKY